VIVKVQMPLSTNSRVLEAHVSNKDKSLEELFPVTRKLDRLMGSRVKAFFHARIIGDKLHIVKEAPWQTW
jgi:hypothetical protein